MPSQTITTTDAAFSVRYRAVCTKGDYTGGWRPEKITAIKDALRHQNANPSHKVRIQVEQKQIMTFSLD